MYGRRIIMSTLFSAPFVKLKIELPVHWREYVACENYVALDSEYQEAMKPDGFLYQILKSFCEFNSLEGIIAVRSAPDDEEGIWHDDGSRVMGFSLALNLSPQSIVGGDLLIRPRFIYSANSDEGANRLSPLHFGELLVFKTGVEDFEHRVTKVLMGKRTVLAGWCS